MKFLVINGPNLNLLGLREPAIYGSQNYEALLALIRSACDAEGIEVDFFQSNHEGAIVDAIQAAYGVYDGPHLRCGQPGAFPAGLLCRHGLCQDLQGSGLPGLCGGCEISEELSQQITRTPLPSGRGVPRSGIGIFRFTTPRKCFMIRKV